MKPSKPGPKPKANAKNRIVTFRTNDELIRAAKELKINVSQIVHKALKEAVVERINLLAG